MQAILSYRGNIPTHIHTNTQYTPTHRQDRLPYTAPQLARSVIALLQLRFEYDSSAIRARFGYEVYEMPTIRARYNILRGAYEELCVFEQ